MTTITPLCLNREVIKHTNNKNIHLDFLLKKSLSLIISITNDVRKIIKVE